MSNDSLHPPALLDARGVAELLGVHLRTVWKLRAAGEIPGPIRIGRKTVRWRVADLEEHISRLKVEGTRVRQSAKDIHLEVADECES